MTNYNLTIISPLGWISRRTTSDRREIYNLRNEAHKFASYLDFKDFDKSVTHIVYYYEKGTDIRILNQPTLVGDEDFEHFVDEYKPNFVGAIHRF